MRGLYLDLAKTVGFAVGAPGEPLLSGEHPLVKNAVGSDQERCCSLLYDWIEDRIATFQPQLLCWEAPMAIQGRSAETAILLFGLANTAGLVGYRHRLRLYKVNVQTARAALGLPNSKDAAHLWCVRQGWEPAGHNAADALVLKAFVEAELERRRVAAAQAPLFGRAG